EPGQQVAVSGTYQLLNLTSPSVSVEFDGHTYAATLTPGSSTRGTFKALVRAYHSGSHTIEAIGAASPPAGRNVIGDPDDVPVTITLAHTTPTVAISSPASNSSLQLGESGCDAQVQVSTADTNTYGPRRVSAQADNTTVDLAPVAGSTTQFAG